MTDPVDGISSISAAVAAIIAAGAFLIKVRQDHIAFRHKQAESARSVVSELYSSKGSMDALNMLDYSALHYYDDGRVRKRELYLTKQMVVDGLRVAETAQLTTADVFIRESFDTLLLYLEQIKGFLDVEYIIWQDVEATIGYYVDLVRRDGELKPAVLKYAISYGFRGAASIVLDTRSYFVAPFRGASNVMAELQPQTIREVDSSESISESH